MVTICTTRCKSAKFHVRLTQCIYIYFVLISEQAVIISLCKIKWLVLRRVRTIAKNCYKIRSSRRLRLPGLLTVGSWRPARKASLTRRPPLPSGEIPGTDFFTSLYNFCSLFRKNERSYKSAVHGNESVTSWQFPSDLTQILWSFKIYHCIPNSTSLSWLTLFQSTSSQPVV